MDSLDASNIIEVEKLIDNIIAQAISLYQNFMASELDNIDEFLNYIKDERLQANDIDWKSELKLESSECISFLPDKSNDPALVGAPLSTTKSPDVTLKIEWCFGINSYLAVHYLDINSIAYCASHLLVIFDLDTRTMKFLKGFTNKIVDISIGNGLLAAADSGLEDFSVILWNTADLSPKKFWSRPLQGGISLLKISPCGEYLTAVSAIIPPTIARWQINGSHISNRIIPVNNAPKHLSSNPRNINQYVITFSQSIVIVNFENEMTDIIKFESPKTSAKLGHYRMSIFINNDSNEIVTGTSQGMAIVWRCNGKYMKSISIHEVGLTWLQIVDDMLVIACEDGSIRVYEKNLCIRSWYRLDSNSIRCMTFNSNRNASLPDFAYLTSSQLGLVFNSRKLKQNLEYNSAFVMSMEVNTVNSTLVTGNSLGLISIYNLSSKILQLKQSLFDSAVTVLKFASKCTVLAAGSDYGDILILDPIICSIKYRLKSARYSIYKIHLCTDGLTLSYVHKGFGAGLFKFNIGWHFRGKCRAHRDEIVDSTLVGHRLFTVAKDRMLSEFDVKHLLRFVTRFRIEETAIPTSCVWSKNLLLVANNEYRIRFIDVEKKEIVKTIRSPGMSPLQKMRIVEDTLFYATGKDLGVCNLPWEGWGSSIQVHGTNIINFCVFQTKVLTSSKNDNVVFMLSINKLSPSFLPSVPTSLHKQVNKKTRGGTIKKCNLIDTLRGIGFFPSKFDAMNILREYPHDKFDNKMLSEIICNHGPPPGITSDEIEQVFIKSSDSVRASDPVIQTNTLISLMQSGPDGMTESDAFQNINILTAPGLMPPIINYQTFLSDVIGIKNNKVKKLK